MAAAGRRKIELLAPAGSYEAFCAVLSAGADAVYLGGSRFGARAYAGNLTQEELKRAIDSAHIHGRRLYLTINTLLKEQELEGELYAYLRPYYEQGLDAVIVQDMGVLSFLRKEFPGLGIHASTQMTVTNRYGAELMKSLGASRVVAARELSLAEIRDICGHADIEVESFIHGALCYCYSGQCLMSSMLGGRSGNRGRCAQPCRLPYEVCDRNGRPLPGKRGKAVQRPDEPYLLSLKDLCTIEWLPQLIESGITSFKIEGRMKQAEYAAGAVSVYRRYVDRCLSLLEQYGDIEAVKARYQVAREDLQKLSDLGNRSGFTDGYYQRRNGKEMLTLRKPSHAKANEKLWEEIREAYIRTEKKEPLKGKLTLRKEAPARLEVSCRGVCAQAKGTVPQPAETQPLTREKAESSLRKTGNTPFAFAELDIEMEEDIFLPLQSLNQLRRDALEKLSGEMAGRHRRKPESPALGRGRDAGAARGAGETPAERNLAVSVERREQIAAACRFAYVSDIYLDSGCYQGEDRMALLKEDAARVHTAGKRAFYALPAVFRKHTMEKCLSERERLLGSGIDGFVVRSFDELQFLRREFLGDCPMPMIFDYPMYACNNRAKRAFGEFSPLRDTVPPELNKKELFGRDNAGSELLIYGYLPLMTSAQCIRASVRGCDGKQEACFLKDRYGKYFPVKNNCGECYNTIYNTAPLLLFDYRGDFEKMGLTCFRISFTVEDEQQIEAVMGLYEEAFLLGTACAKERYDKEYTHGHYKRGVE